MACLKPSPRWQGTSLHGPVQQLAAHRFANFRLLGPSPMRISLGVLKVAIWRLGVDHIPHKMVAHLLPALRGSGVVLVLPDEPRVPSARERNRIQPGERLTITVLRCTQGGDAGFNLAYSERVFAS